MTDHRRKETRYIAVAAVCSALSVVLLGLGSLIEVLDLSMAAVASLMVVFAVIELPKKYAWLIYAVTSVLSFLLLPSKTPALLYAFFLGFYPIFKGFFERHFPRPLAYTFKALLFAAAFVLYLFLALRLFTEVDISTIPIWVYALSIPVFFLYDVALSRLIGAYVYRWRGKFSFIHK